MIRGANLSLRAGWEPSPTNLHVLLRHRPRSISLPTGGVSSDREEVRLLLALLELLLRPVDPGKLTERADADWKETGLTRTTLHACRHTFASYMIAAGVNAKALSTYMGHATIAVTLDLYGHLMPGSESEAAELLDVYLTAQRERADDAARAGDFPLRFPTAIQIPLIEPKQRPSAACTTSDERRTAERKTA